jgi:hypothetical protein
MSIVIRFLTLLTIAAAGFALPMSCAQGASAVDVVPVTQPTFQVLDAHLDVPVELTDTDAAPSLAKQVRDLLPFDCGDAPTSRASEQPATFATQPFVPGYLVATIQLDEETTHIVVPPLPPSPVDSRAGPPDAPPPQSID